MSDIVSFALGVAANTSDIAKDAYYAYLREVSAYYRSMAQRQIERNDHEEEIKKLKDEIAGLKEVIGRTKVSKEKPFWHCTNCKKWSEGYVQCGHCRVRIIDMDPKPEGAP